MDSVFEVIERVKNTTKRTEKENILKENVNNNLLKEIFKFVYDPYVISGISAKKINKKIKSNTMSTTLYDISGLLSYLKDNNTGRDVDIETAKKFIDQFKDNKDIYRFLIDIVTKNLKIGLTAKTLNKVYDSNFIPEFEVMLARNFKDYKKEITSFALTEKLNGMRCVIVKENNKIRCISRQGQGISDLIDIEMEAMQLPDNFVYDGELIAINEDNLNSDDLFRKTVSIARKDEIKRGLIFHIFDSLPLNEFKKGESNVSYAFRRMHIMDRKISSYLNFIKKVPILYMGKDVSKIDYYSEQAVKESKEGIMLNFINRKYECKRTDAILKVIKYNKADVKVTKVLEGTNKNKNKLGAIEIQFIYNNNLYKSQCGTGFTDDERERYFKNPELLLNKIVTIEYKDITKDKGGAYNIRNASWKGIIRDDKCNISMH